MILSCLLRVARRLPGALLALALLLTPAQPGHGRTPAPSGASPAQPQQTPRVLLPVVARGPEVGIQFGTGVDDQNNLLDPGTAFAYGIARLYYRYTVAGAAGRRYRTEWRVDGARQPLLDDSGTIPEASAVFTNSFCSPTLGDCDQPVPRAVYQVRFYIDEVFYQEATAVVQ